MSARILIIEDNPANMELMIYLLTAFRHIPLLAYDGEEGIETARAQQPDLILCDVHLPKLDGYAVVHLLKNDPVLGKIPAIAVTALSMVGDREKLLSAGFDDYIGKPIDPEAFIGQIEKFLSTNRHSGTTYNIVPAGAGDADCPDNVKRATILVVDDFQVNRELIRCTLEPFGYTLVFGDSVREARERLQHGQFDLILCDFHMPGEDGCSLLRTVSENPHLVGVPFLLLSASSSCFEDERRACELGAKRFLRRPIEPQRLVDEIEACLSECKGDQDGYHSDRR